ncbi:DUF6460 domain-containing protein [Acuticoccus sp.]|uniref:DUF6460 domain-containing protein n=1 Tax=Acuticoccus sp. TaxID=1904378 RepID=UPI003B51766F
MSEYDKRISPTERVLGGSPLGVLVRLLVMSFVVGVILTVLDVNPNDVINWLDTRFRALTNLGLGSIEQAVEIMLVGAVIVVPVWLLLRVLKILAR